MNKDLLIGIYVDDIIIIGNDCAKISEFKKHISNKFKTKDLGTVSYILGLQIEYLNNDTLLIHQKNYIDKMITKYSLNDCKDEDIPIQPNNKLTNDLNNENDHLKTLIDPTKYRKAIGTLIYLMTSTRPDISYSVG